MEKRKTKKGTMQCRQRLILRYPNGEIRVETLFYYYYIYEHLLFFSPR